MYNILVYVKYSTHAIWLINLEVYKLERFGITGFCIGIGMYALKYMSHM